MSELCGSTENLFGANLKGAYSSSDRSGDPCSSYAYTSVAGVARTCYFCKGLAAGTTNTLYFDDFRVPVTANMLVDKIYIWATGTTDPDYLDGTASTTF